MYYPMIETIFEFCNLVPASLLIAASTGCSLMLLSVYLTLAAITKLITSIIR